MANRGIGKKTFRYTSGRKRAAKNGYYGTGATTSYNSSQYSEPMTFTGVGIFIVGLLLFLVFPGLGILLLIFWMNGSFD